MRTLYRGEPYAAFDKRILRRTYRHRLRDDLRRDVDDAVDDRFMDQSYANDMTEEEVQRIIDWDWSEYDFLQTPQDMFY